MSEPHTIVEEKDMTFPPVLEDTKRCPACLYSWVGTTIPVDSRHFYGDKTHFSLLIGVEVPGRYDGIHNWQCPKCSTEFPRWIEKDGKPVRRMFRD